MDVALIRAFVDLAFDGISPKKRLSPQSRSDLSQPKENEGLRKLATYGLGAAFNKQSCMDRLLCQTGDLLSGIKGKALVFA